MKALQTQQSGYSLLEIAGVLVITAVMTLGFFSLYTKAVSKALAGSSSNVSFFEYSPNITFGPYLAEQIFFDKNQSKIFLGEKCASDFSCRRSFCGQFEIKNKNEIYLHLKDLDHCITNLAKY